MIDFTIETEIERPVSEHPANLKRVLEDGVTAS
jgi:hypothetical protein